jgi:hypothetical protein
MTAFLVPAARNRYELYSEAPEGPPAPPESGSGRIRQLTHRVSVRWHELVETARRGRAPGRLARWRDAIVSRLAETIAEQRTLWALVEVDAAVLRHPSTLDAERARTILFDALVRARRHHGGWLLFDLVIFVTTGVLAVVPGPNLLAYYFAFRVIGHFQSWRGARQALDRIAWTFEADATLAELASLVDVPREARAPRVAAIAARLNLPRLTAFFDRVAVPSA